MLCFFHWMTHQDAHILFFRMWGPSSRMSHPNNTPRPGLILVSWTCFPISKGSHIRYDSKQLYMLLCMYSLQSLFGVLHWCHASKISVCFSFSRSPAWGSLPHVVVVAWERHASWWFLMMHHGDSSWWIMMIPHDESQQIWDLISCITCRRVVDVVGVGDLQMPALLVWFLMCECVYVCLFVCLFECMNVFGILSSGRIRLTQVLLRGS